MTMLPRLEKAARALTGKERVVLFLKARNAGHEPEVDLKQFPNETECRQYDRYMGVVYVANAELGMLCQVIKNQADWLAADRQVFEILHEAAEEVAFEEGEPVDWRRARRLDKRATVAVSLYLANLSEHVREVAAARVVMRWKELRALELVWDAMARDFDGENPVDPQLRQVAASARATLTSLAGRCRIKKLPEPEQDFIDRTWEMVDHAYDALKLVKEEP